MENELRSHPRFFRACIALLGSNGYPLRSRVIHITAPSESDAQAIAEHFADTIEAGSETATSLSLDIHPMEHLELLDLDQVDAVLDLGSLPFDHPATLISAGRALH